MQAAGEMACSCRAECVAMAAGLQMLIRNLPRKRCRRVAAVFTDSLSLLTALNTGPLRVRDGILRRIWTLILSLVRDKARPSFPFVFWALWRAGQRGCRCSCQTGGGAAARCVRVDHGHDHHR